MPRRREVPKRAVPADPVYDSTLVTKFVRTIMKSGKRSVAEGIVYGSLDIIKDRTGDDPLKIFKKAVDNTKPSLEVKSRRVGGSNYQVPIEVTQNRRLSLSIRWLTTSARAARRREDDAGEARERADRRVEPPRRLGEEARRHAPDGGSEQSVRPLPMVSALFASAGGSRFCKRRPAAGQAWGVRPLPMVSAWREQKNRDNC